MNKTKFSYKVSIILFSFFFLTSNLNKTFAQGPNSPEAASFEPVDATDMVNLVTGDLSYVLPLLNIPSPEGGYPIALSYHAGIAMDQEASWVGLGWSLNPGAINRGVNGYPDDWGKTNVNEFFYDKGWDKDYYSFGAGISFKGGLSVGLGLSWGSNQSVGGYVSASIGPGFGEGAGPSIGGSIGINGSGNLTASINGSLGTGLSASISTSGVGIGYNTQTTTSLGLSLNYNYSSGLSGGVSVNTKTGTFKNKLDKYSGVGINFSSNGFSMNAKVNGFGAGISTSTSSISAGDYDVSVSTTNIFIPAYIFYVSYSHTNVKYSLYKYNDLYTSGMAYPVMANELQTYYDSSNLSRLLKENHFMDVNLVQKFGRFDKYDDLIKDSNKNDRNNLVLPNYDNYTVNAQGLSGTISPYFYSELNLSARGRGEQNEDNEYVQYLNHDIAEYNSTLESGISVNRDAIAKKYFTFASAYNSFLRLKTSNINKDPNSSTVHSDYIMKDYNTNSTYDFNRKREGNSIETYTNKEIRENNIVGFIEAKEGDNQLNRQDTNTFLDEGIGAFQITSLDGKTYHYSLPVYQFESFYKNFRNVNGNGDAIASEDEYFFEVQKTTPYATHWLLTAITGPDYVDNNSNGKVDKQDYGYWVEFDYGKWSDGYAWQTPNGRFEEISDKYDATKKTYSYTWGRKQIYYLDAIKTRTHTALFIKDIRDDNLSVSKQTYLNKKLENESFDLNYHSKKCSAEDGSFCGYFLPNVYSQQFFDYNNNPISFNLGDFSGVLKYNNKVTFKYFDIPITTSLKLKKIILVKNKDSIISKSHGILTNKLKGYLGFSNGYNKIIRLGLNGTSCYSTEYPYLLTQKYQFQEFNSNIDDNILDIKDIEGLDLESKASQVIEFEHNYSLADNAPNTSSGRLTLEKVYFKGKKGTQVMPPYEFKYLNATTDYNKNYIDAWGYHKTNPQVWSLDEITTPTGGKIKIEYEPDAYYAEAACPDDPLSDITSITSSGGNSLTFYFGNSTDDLRNYFVKDRFYRITYRRTEEDFDEIMNKRTDDYDEFFQVIDVGLDWVQIIDPEPNSDFVRFAPIVNCDISMDPYCIERIFIYGISNGLTSNKVDGGIRTKSITISDGVKNIATTDYIYENGITSYAPTKEQKGVPYVSELPAPMVMYGNVKMLNKDGSGNELGSTAYEFETLEPRKEESGYIFSLGEAFRVKENQNETFENGAVIANKHTIESKLGNLGRIKSITSFNNKNQILHIKENRYKQNLDTDGEIGVTQESHSSYKRVLKDDVETFFVSSTSKINYPSVLESTKVTQSGFSIEKYFDKYDFLTGQLLETRTYANDGTAFKTKTVPAYTKYPAMGSKVDDVTNKNMLSQQAASYTYLLDENDNIDRVIGAGITTWNNDWTYRDETGNESLSSTEVPVWRKHKSFFWQGDIDSDGAYIGFNDNNDDGFEWGLGLTQTNLKWKQASETTRYDHYSAPLEAEDINGNFASTKMCDDHSKVMAVSNAKYTEMYYSGAEYFVKDENGDNSGYFDGEVKSTGRIPDTDAHTGNYIVAVGLGQNAFEVTIPPNTERTGLKSKFKVSVWVSKGEESNVKIKVGSLTVDFNVAEQQTAGNWVMLNGYITIPTSETLVAIVATSGTIHLDDFRLLPMAASMTSYVYNEWDELWYIIGANGLATKYYYDHAGRLSTTYTEVVDNDVVEGGFKPISTNNYHYKNQQ